MPLDYKAAMAATMHADTLSYTIRDTMIYAQGLGMGGAPGQLPFVFEGAGPKVMPTLPVVLVRSNSASLGIDMRRVLHAAQRLEIHAPLPPEGTVLADTRTLSIIDKGEGRGAFVEVETVGRLAPDASPSFTLVKTLFARGDGGCGAPATSPPAPHPIPVSAPDLVVTIPTATDQALRYRLSGDYNPLHADPEFAARAGFERPILHGLCTWGMAARAIMESICDHDPTCIRAIDARFAAPVYPGETLVFSLWVDGETVSFRCHVSERAVVVLDNGRCRIRPV